MWLTVVRWGILYSCPKAERDALTARLSLLTRCYVSIDVLESPDFVEVGVCGIVLSLAKSLVEVNDFLPMLRMRWYLACK